MPTATVPQAVFPGQAAAPGGPIDLLPMFLMHHAFRRDLIRFADAAAHTPTGDQATWAALTTRWHRFSRILHAHHQGEDAIIWPALMRKAGQDGRATLQAMEAEHDEIDPLLDGCARGLAELAQHPDADTHAALVVRMRATQERLGQHLAHEERDALALVQRHFTPQEWAETDRQIAKHYDTKDIPFTLAWLFPGVPGALLPQVKGFLGAPMVFLGRKVFARRLNRLDRRAFAHAAAVDGAGRKL